MAQEYLAPRYKYVSVYFKPANIWGSMFWTFVLLFTRKYFLKILLKKNSTNLFYHPSYTPITFKTEIVIYSTFLPFFISILPKKWTRLFGHTVFTVIYSRFDIVVPARNMLSALGCVALSTRTGPPASRPYNPSGNIDFIISSSVSQSLSVGLWETNATGGISKTHVVRKESLNSVFEVSL